MPYYCFQCKKEVSIGDRVGRTESCPFCHSDLHCCLNCLYYDPAAYNECHEPNAERVLEKEKANFCDYFSFAEKRGLAKGGGVEEARKKLEGLFGKK